MTLIEGQMARLKTLPEKRDYLRLDPWAQNWADNMVGKVVELEFFNRHTNRWHVYLEDDDTNHVLHPELLEAIED